MSIAFRVCRSAAALGHRITPALPVAVSSLAAVTCGGAQSAAPTSSTMLSRCFHASSGVRGMDEFFAPPLKEGEQPRKAGTGDRQAWLW